MRFGVGLGLLVVADTIGYFTLDQSNALTVGLFSILFVGGLWICAAGFRTPWDICQALVRRLRPS